MNAVCSADHSPTVSEGPNQQVFFTRYLFFEFWGYKGAGQGLRGTSEQAEHMARSEAFQEMLQGQLKAAAPETADRGITTRTPSYSTASRSAHERRTRVNAEANATLDQVSYVGRHFFDRSMVEHLQLLQGAKVFYGDKVDGHTLATKTATAANAVDVVLSVRRQVVVDDE